MALIGVAEQIPMPSREEISETLCTLVSQVLSIERVEVTPDSDLINDFGMESIAAVEIIIALEKQFGIKLNARQMREMSVVRDVIDHVEKAVEETNSSYSSVSNPQAR